jgi:signal transduction histidine kinase
VNLELSRSLDYEPTLRRVAGLAVPTLADSCVVDMADRRANSLLQPSMVVVPLVARGEVMGTMTLAVDESGRRFGPHDLALAEDLATRVSFAVHNARTTRQLRSAVESRDELLASVSHDLKNPIAAIKGISQLVQRRLRREGPVDRARLLEDLEHIDEVAKRTAMQVDELLDISRMQMDRPLDLDRSPTDIVALVRRAVGEHQQQTNRHALSVDTDVPELVGDWDQLRLSRALDQLLENAIKYSPNGGAIDVSVRRTEANGGSAELSIQDQGIGIPSDETDRIFDRFERGSNAENRIAGTGLGLAGARYIVESHGGTISAHNRPGGGARFVIQLPLAAEESRL